MAERITPEGARTFRRLNRISTTLGAAGLGLSLVGGGLSAYNLEHALSGATAREYAQDNPNATPEQIRSNSASRIENGVGSAAINAVTLGLSIGALELSRRARRRFRENNSQS